MFYAASGECERKVQLPVNFQSNTNGRGKVLCSVCRVNASVSAPSPPLVQGSSRGELPAIGWEQGREAKEENPPLNLGSDEWVAVQDFSLLDGWGDADAKKGNVFSLCIFTSKMPWKAAHTGLHLLMRQLKVTGGWRSSSCTILQCHAASPCPVPPLFHAFGLADSTFSYSPFVLFVFCFCIQTHQIWQPSEWFFFQSCNLNMLGCIVRLSSRPVSGNRKTTTGYVSHLWQRTTQGAFAWLKMMLSATAERGQIHLSVPSLSR